MYESDKKIKEAVKVALAYRERARTFDIKVGVALETYDGEIFGGFNVETYAHKGYHAEEVALIRALSEGYNGVDFKRMVVVFQDTRNGEVEIYPGCPLSCWGYLWEFTHPGLEIVVADTHGTVRYKTTLNEIIHPPAPGKVFPSEEFRKRRPKSNSEPKSLRPGAATGSTSPVIR